MQCLLCWRAVAPRAPAGASTWQVDCAHCGRYRFDASFGEFVEQARARQDHAVLRYLTRLSSAMQNADAELTITRENFARLVEELD